jgi:hypothetical protein
MHHRDFNVCPTIWLNGPKSGSYLSINIGKRTAASLSSKLQPTSHIYYIYEMTVPCHDTYVDLGITFNIGLSFELHVNSIVSKAQQCSSVLLRGFLSRNLSTMKKACIKVLIICAQY